MSDILDRLIQYRDETTRDEQVSFRSGRSTIDHVFIVRSVTAVLEASTVSTFGLRSRFRLSSPRSSSQCASRRWSSRKIDDMNRETTAAVRTLAGCTTPFGGESGATRGRGETLSVQLCGR
ncbi:hypothetical protein RB195_024772 [Necator americanus]|uniref:Uncharacterized protein n=1 Tax=Necator americanus TaxID=51031 RepID=A0ABR1EPK9_NECAM